MKVLIRFSIFSLFIILISQTVFAQGFLHREGKYIFDGSGNEVILRGIGTGNWMIQEGYMMQTSGVAGAQHEIKEKLIETIGIEKTDSFYTVWLDSHFRKIDVDSMKSWGFNSVRVAMHYLWFTPPVEDEPIQGEITWLETGFTMMDSLLAWCSENEMYLILDLHGAPGGQGKETNISDYDPSKPSLWESQANKDKTIALWKKLAERYSSEPWIGGYDLINETNWTFPSGNAPLWDLFKNITAAIREVDNNHLIFLEGNWFANDYNGLPAIWDDNMALSFHKYWTYNDEGSLNWMINLRNSRNIPLWLGESGENSNTWFTSLIALCEKNRIGWSWWPVKKPGINNPLKVTVNDDYTQLIEFWKGNAPNPGVDAAFAAVLQFAENHKLKNCTFQKDVVDAMIRQPFTTETIPFKINKTDEPIFAADYNLGRNGYAYFDNDTADFHGNTNEFISWNQGWAYRNDGVDIETCNDSDTTNGFNVGWTGDGEWMEYTVLVDSTASYTLKIRSASGASGSKVHLEVNGVNVTPIINLPGTSSWYNWQTTEITGVILEKGIQKIRFVFDNGGSNLNYFQFSNPVSIDDLPFKYVNAESTEDGKKIKITLNKPVTSPIEDASSEDFNVTIRGKKIEINSISLEENNPNTIILELNENLYYGGVITITYKGNNIFNLNQALTRFTNAPVTNNLPLRYNLPARIQSEDFYFNNGLVSETCTDIGGGYDMGYAAPGDYLDYLVFVPQTRYYTINFRVATIKNNNQLIIRAGEEGSFTSLDTISFNSTGDWQKWVSVPTSVLLQEGRYTLRMYVRAGEFNTNWFQVENGPLVGIETYNNGNVHIYPNPASDFVNVNLSGMFGQNFEITLTNILGQTVKTLKVAENSKIKINVAGLERGIYNVQIKSDKNIFNSSKLIVN